MASPPGQSIKTVKGKLHRRNRSLLLPSPLLVPLSQPLPLTLIFHPRFHGQRQRQVLG